MNGMNIESKEMENQEFTEKDIVIKLNGLSKVYNLYRRKEDRLKEALHPRRKKYHREFYALNGVDLEIGRGESVGILGMNGAGKSTLLKAITRVITPTSGSVQVDGQISALLELGSGFNPEFSGYENVFFYGALMGFTEKQMNEKIDEILEFADIGEYIYQPLKTYSSGMKSRLAFAVATSIEPDILILDEVLSVGDMFFQAKCTLRMQNMIKSQNTTVLFVSHNINAVKAICERSILLEGGKVVMDGNTQDVVNEYFKKKVTSRQTVIQSQIAETDIHIDKHSSIIDYMEGVEEFLKKASHGRVNNGKAEFLNVQLLDENETILKQVEYGQKVILRMMIKALNNIPELGFGYHIRDKNGTDVIYGSAGVENKKLKNITKGDLFIVDWKFCLKILQGQYSILSVLSVVIDSNKGVVEFCDLIPISCQFEMMSRSELKIFGFVYLDNILEIKKM